MWVKDRVLAPFWGGVGVLDSCGQSPPRAVQAPPPTASPLPPLLAKPSLLKIPTPERASWLGQAQPLHFRHGIMADGSRCRLVFGERHTTKAKEQEYDDRAT